MFNYNFSDFYWFYPLIVLINFLFFLLVYASFRIFCKKYYLLFLQDGAIAYFAFISISFGFLAMTTGLLVGTSKSPVVGVIIPSILTFYAGLMTYLFVFSNKESKIKDSIAVGISIISLSISLIVGADYGASMRTKSEFINDENTFRRDLEKMELEDNIKRKTVSIESPSMDFDSSKVKLKTSPKR